MVSSDWTMSEDGETSTRLSTPLGPYAIPQRRDTPLRSPNPTILRFSSTTTSERSSLYMPYPSPSVVSTPYRSPPPPTPSLLSRISSPTTTPSLLSRMYPAPSSPNSISALSSLRTAPVTPLPSPISRFSDLTIATPRTPLPDLPRYVPPQRRERPPVSRGRNFHPEYVRSLGMPVVDLHMDDLPIHSTTEISDLRVAGSYKWIESSFDVDERTPTIVIPGVPDVWVGEGRQVGRVDRDEDLPGNIEYPDYNAHSVPAGYSPLEPVILSLSSPKFLRRLDVITGRNNLKKLFAFCLAYDLSNGPAYKEELRNHGYRFGLGTFRIDTSFLPGTRTVIMDRWEPPRNQRGFIPSSWHLAYHERMTIPLHEGADRTSGCHRIVRYDFGGIEMMVKSDVDAALPWDGAFSTDPSDMFGDDTTSIAESCFTEDTSTIDDHMSVDAELTEASLNGLFTVVNPGTEQARATAPTSVTQSLSARDVYTTSSGIQVVRSQIPQPPQGHLITVKTRTVDLDPRMCAINKSADVYAGMLFGQVPNLLLATHIGGDFSRGQLRRLLVDEGELLEMGREYDGIVGMVRGVVQSMVDITREKGRMSFVGANGSIVGFRATDREARFSREAEEIIRLGQSGGFKE